MDMETLLPQVANYGFPMVLSWYLLVRMEGRLDRLTDSINSLARSIAGRKNSIKKDAAQAASFYFISLFTKRRYHARQPADRVRSC